MATPCRSGIAMAKTHRFGVMIQICRQFTLQSHLLTLPNALTSRVETLRMETLWTYGHAMGSKIKNGRLQLHLQDQVHHRHLRLCRRQVQLQQHHVARLIAVILTKLQQSGTSSPTTSTSAVIHATLILLASAPFSSITI